MTLTKQAGFNFQPLVTLLNTQKNVMPRYAFDTASSFCMACKAMHPDNANQGYPCEYLQQSRGPTNQAVADSSMP